MMLKHKYLCIQSHDVFEVNDHLPTIKHSLQGPSGDLCPQWCHVVGHKSANTNIVVSMERLTGEPYVMVCEDGSSAPVSLHCDMNRSKRSIDIILLQAHTNTRVKYCNKTHLFIT